jgi:hypothetical protein
MMELNGKQLVEQEMLDLRAQQDLKVYKALLVQMEQQDLRARKEYKAQWEYKVHKEFKGQQVQESN